jgi:peptidoglycan/LPS O-acetylase OafA/YrhL
VSFDRGVLILLALFVLVAGLASFASPASLAQQAGWSATPGGLTEIRAFYGGLQVGLGCFLVWCTRRRERLLSGLLVAGFAVGGIGIARAFGLFLDQAPTAYHLGNLAVEIATVALVAVAVSRHRKRAHT